MNSSTADTQVIRTAATNGISRLPDALKVRASHQADEIAHDDGDRTLTFARWDRAADELGGGLAAQGLLTGQRVLLPISNKHVFEMVIAVIGVMRAGGIACPVNPRLMPDEMSAYAALVEPAMTITDVPERMANAPAGIVFSVDRMPSDMAALPDQSTFDPAGDAEILQTSGTTGGKLKGVVVSHRDLLGDCDGISRQPSRSMAHALPLTGSGGNRAAGMLPIKTGATCYTQRKFDAAGFLRLVSEKKPDTIFLVPSMLRLILDLPDVGEHDLSGTKWLITGSAPLPHDSVVRTLKLWPHIRMRNSYAMSEGGASLTTTTREQILKPGCVGKMNETLELRGDDGAPVTQGQTGEIYGRQGKPARYWRDEQASSASFIGEWTRTGDLAYVDTDGDLILCGRSKELIIRGGYNITPLEIETVLHDHPAVKDAAVLGIAHEVLGEDVAAAVALATGAQATAQELETWCRARLADNKVPRTILILNELPLNANGKFLKRELKPLLEQAAAARRGQTTVS